MSLVALAKAIKSCDEFVKKGKTEEDRKLRKEACQPTIDEAIRAVENLTKKQIKMEKKAQKHAEKLEKEAAKHAKKLEKEAQKHAEKLEKHRKKQEKALRWLERNDSVVLENAERRRRGLSPTSDRSMAIRVYERNM